MLMAEDEAIADGAPVSTASYTELKSGRTLADHSPVAQLAHPPPPPRLPDLGVPRATDNLHFLV